MKPRYFFEIYIRDRDWKAAKGSKTSRIWENVPHRVEPDFYEPEGFALGTGLVGPWHAAQSFGVGL